MTQRYLRLFCVVTIFGVASLSFAKPTATPTPTPAPTATPKPSATPTPAPTATPKPSATPTATPAPTVTPSPSATASTAYCPLPVDYGLASSSTTSPEKGPGPLKALCHHPTPDQSSNFIILCLPPNAYNAHIQHGDTPVAFNCTKEGNQGPCGP